MNYGLLKIKRSPATRWLWLLVLLSFCGSACGVRSSKSEAEEPEERSYVVGRFAFKRLEKVDNAVAKKEYVEAQGLLDELAENEELNPHERALMHQSRGQVLALQKKYAGAAESFAKCLEQDALSPESTANVQYNLGQMYMVTEQYGAAIAVMEQFLAGGREATHQIHQMLAGAHVQEGTFEKALPHAQALLDEEDPDTEASLQLMLAIRVQLKQYGEAITLLKTLVHRFPEKKSYWMQLSAAYAQNEQNDRALATLALAYKQGYLEEEGELMQLVHRYLGEGLPLKGATLLATEMKDKRIARSAKTLELLANAWMAARRVEEALAAMEAAAEVAKGGEVYLRLAQVYAQEELWVRAAQAASRAVSRGKLKDAGSAYLVLGMAHYQNGARSAAREAFAKARSHAKSQAAAQQWLDAMQKEQDSCPTGNEAACHLIPGHKKM